MTNFDIAARIRQEWQVKPTKKERVALAAEALSLICILLSIAVTMHVLSDMLKDYVVRKYVKDKEADEYWRQHSRTVHAVADDNSVQ